MATFYMVYLENGGTPTCKHQTLELAELEAKRLAGLYKQKAFVLCTVISFEINHFTVEDCRPNPDELPF